MSHEKVIIVGSLCSLRLSSRITTDIKNLFQLPIKIVPVPVVYDQLEKIIMKHPNSYVLFCPTKIPKTIRAQLRRLPSVSFLEENNISLGHLRIKNGLITGISLFKKDVSFEIFPRKTKREMYKRHFIYT